MRNAALFFFQQFFQETTFVIVFEESSSEAKIAVVAQHESQLKRTFCLLFGTATRKFSAK